MRTLLIIGAGGFLGAVARYLMGGFVQQRLGIPFPWGTIAVNVIGCACLGGLLTVNETRGGLSPEMRFFVGVGILGSLTTFSAFGWETLELARGGAFRLATLNVTANVVLGLTATWFGRVAIRALAG
jgi:CrcB protein